MTYEELVEFVYDAVMMHSVDTHTEGQWVRMRCPECEERGKYKGATFGANVVDGRWHCFRCGVRGKCAALVRDYGAVEAIAPRPEAPQLPSSFVSLQDALKDDPNDFVARQVMDYLLGRGFEEHAIYESMTGFARRGFYRGRAIIPVWTWGNIQSGFVGRRVDGFNDPFNHDEKPISFADLWEQKYIYPKGLSRDDFYLAEDLRLKTEEPALIVEGCLDALAYWPDAVATLAKPTHTQLRLIAEHAERPLVVALDHDARRESVRAAADLRRLRPDLRVGCIGWRGTRRVSAARRSGETLVRSIDAVSDVGGMAGLREILRAAALKSLEVDTVVEVE